MYRNASVLPLMLVALLAGGALYPHLGDARSSTPSSQSAIPIATSQIGAVAGSEPGKEQATGAIDLLADFFGIDVSEDGLKRSVRFGGLDKAALALEVVKEAAANKDVTVRFLVATVPDAVDSHAGWQFDTIVDAIRSAVNASGYVLDRFYMPDIGAEVSPNAKAGTVRGHLHERWPGLILFRDTGTVWTTPDPPQTSHRRNELLLVFLVAETPTFGIHQAAFVKALSFITQWDAQHLFPILVLGPTFSGSISSLANALRNVSKELIHSHVRFVSGSATRRENKATLERAIPDQVTFAATVPPDETAAWIPYLYLIESNPNLAGRVAALQEDNTGYGHAQILVGQPGIKGLPFPMHISRLRSDSTRARPNTSEPQNAPQRFRPLSLEELVTPTDQLPAPSFKTTSSYVELVLANILDTIRRENIAVVGLLATDTRDKLFLAQQIAANCPNTTLFTVESDLLYAHPDFVSYMAGALVASAYPLYNGNQIWSWPFSGGNQRRQFPTSAAQGVYNAALALLDYREQDEDPPPVLENPGLARVGVPNQTNPPPLLDYATPGESCTTDVIGCAPPVWLSVASRGTLWPMKAVPLKPDNYTFRVRIPDVPRRPTKAQKNFPSAGSQFLFILLTIVVAFHLVICFLITRWKNLAIAGENTRPYYFQERLQRLAERFQHHRVPQLRRYSIAFFSLCLAYGSLTVLVGMWLRSGSADLSGLWAVLAWALAVGLGLCASWLAWSGLLSPLFVTVGNRWHDRKRHLLMQAPQIDLSLRGGFIAVVVVGLCAWGSWNLIQYFWMFSGETSNDRTNGLLLVERATDLGNGVSPIVPVLFLAAALYLWGVVELARNYLPKATVTDDETKLPSLIGRCANGRVNDLTAKFSFLNGSILKLPNEGILMVAMTGVLIVCFVFDPFINPLMTIEGQYFNRFVTSFVLLLHFIIALALLQFVYQWSVLREFLRRLAWHPMLEFYGRIPERLLPRGLVPRQPKLIELQVLVDHWRTIYPSADQVHRSDSPPSPQAVSDQFESDLAKSAVWSASGAWGLLVSAADSVAKDLQGRWAKQATRKHLTPSLRKLAYAAESAVSPGTSQELLYGVAIEQESVDESAERRRLEEAFVVMPIVFVIRDVIARLGQNVLFIMGAVLLLLCSHVLYPFQSKQRVMAFIWTDILVGMAVVLTVLVQFERDAVVSRISSTTPGKISWDRDFVSKLVVYGLVPLLGLFATQFPEVGGTLLRWLEPVQKAIP
jgi:hypothetical protein